MSKKILLTLCLLSVVLIACGKTETTNNEANSKAPNNATVPPTNNATSTVAAADKIGMAECDDFIAKYEACVTDKVPAASRATFESTLKQWRASWKQLAANPQGKPVLESACKNALEQARTSMKTYNCTF